MLINASYTSAKRLKAAEQDKHFKIFFARCILNNLPGIEAMSITCYELVKMERQKITKGNRKQ